MAKRKGDVTAASYDGELDNTPRVGGSKEPVPTSGTTEQEEPRQKVTAGGAPSTATAYSTVKKAVGGDSDY